MTGSRGPGAISARVCPVSPVVRFFALFRCRFSQQTVFPGNSSHRSSGGSMPNGPIGPVGKSGGFSRQRG